MKISSSIALRPFLWFTVLAILVLVIPISAIFSYKTMVARVESSIQFASDYFHEKILSDIQKIEGFPINSVTANLARLLHASLDATESSFSKIKEMVVPKLFLMFSMFPFAQVSYMQPDGLFFSYYTETNRTLAIYSNTSIVQTTPNISTWYTQLVDEDTGVLYGDVTVVNPNKLFVNSSWFQKAMNSSEGYGIVGNGWRGKNEPLFLSMASTNGGVVSLGIPIRSFAESINEIETFSGSLFLATTSGKLLAHSGPLDASMTVKNGNVSFEFMRNDGVQTNENLTISCQPSNELLRARYVKVAGEKYMFYCSPLVIAGVHSVSVLVLPENGLLVMIKKYKYVSFSLSVVSLVCMFLAIAFFVTLIWKAARREMVLCSTLVRQMEFTQQAERKSMNKTMAYANANHDIRGAMATITGLIDISLHEVSAGSDMHTNLSQMKVCSSDLLDLLNSVLDATKIEAGKMQLQEEPFDLAKVIEESVDFIYVRAMGKGLDVMLDPCDGSILKSSIVKGDRGKLKQILNNLLSNAVKFTSNGHIVLRAWVKKPSLETSILPSKKCGTWKSMLRLVYKNTSDDYSNALHTVQKNEDSLEILFEVDDTGKGIPKEDRVSIFENFVQVKETQGGTGLGLGIVQSLVRLMGGEIRIVDKEDGQSGTCFSFNIFLSKGDNVSYTIGEREDSMVLRDVIINGQNQSLVGPSTRNQSPISEGSHIVLVLDDSERTKIIKNFLQILGVKVTSFSNVTQLQKSLKNGSPWFSYPNNSLSSSGISDFGYSSSGTEGSSHHRKVSSSSTFTVVVIDDNLDDLAEVCSVISTFRNKHYVPRLKVVKLGSSSICDDEDMMIHRNTLLNISDYTIRKPLHGSRLFELIRLLPEFGGTFFDMQPLQPIDQVEELHVSEIQLQPKQSSVRLEHVKQEDDKPLSGMTFLVVDDAAVLRKVSGAIIYGLGGIVELCENGEEAFEKIKTFLQEIGQNIQEQGKAAPPYDFILMDGEMPKMNGYEAAKQIRELEKQFGVYIPIIAVTGDDSTEEAKQSGMDYHITKPITKIKLLDAIGAVNDNLKMTKEGSVT